MASKRQVFEFIVKKRDAGRRVDVFLDARRPELSRSRIKKLIQAGEVLIDGRVAKPAHLLKTNEHIRLEVPPAEAMDVLPEAVKLEILYEDADLLVVNKPAERVVHPGAGNREGTLVNAILHHCPDLSGIGGKLRPGIVHRLDKGTSGALLVAKNDETHRHLSRQFQGRQVKKVYLAFVWGTPRPPTGIIDRPIGRDSKNRKKISSRSAKSRDAVTEYEVKKSWGSVSVLEIKPMTGRTHQIRVHLAESGHPIVGDPLYGKGVKRMGALPPAVRNKAKSFTYQLLHAARLSFTHPKTGKALAITAPIRQEMAEFLKGLDKSVEASGK